MNESIHEPLPLRELLHPRTTPEMAFQSYNALAGDGDYRDAQKAAFIAGEVVNPVLDYPNLDKDALTTGISKLQTILDASETQTDPNVRSAVWDSASYRMAEMFWLLSSKQVVDAHSNGQTTGLDDLVNWTQELNEQLYGKPEQQITDSIKAETWAQIDEKELVGKAIEIKRELDEGFAVEIGGETITVPALKRTEAVRLRTMPSGLLSCLKSKLETDRADAKAIVDEYYRVEVAERPESERKFYPADLLDILNAVLKLRDQQGTSGVNVIFNPNANATSWETPLMSVVVGGRRPAIDSPNEVFGIVEHELDGHGGRAISGLETDLPVLGTGLFTDADEGESSDYLTFEEGLMGTCQMAVESDGSEQKWAAGDLDKPLAISLAYDGASFRQTFETLWRARVLMLAKNGIEPSEKIISTAQK